MILSELLNAIGKYEVNNNKLLKAYGTSNVEDISSDSRNIRKGYIFVCINGANVDGHIYAEAAIARGAKIIVAERIPEMIKSDTLVIITDDSRRAYALICGEFFSHPDKNIHVVGITGTKGKTTTALMIKSILEYNHIPCGYIGSNGIIYSDKELDSCNTTPDIKLIYRYISDMVVHRIRYVVIEVSSQALWQKRVYGINFDTCIFTNISCDHIGGVEHPDFEHYMACKASLFTDYGAKHIIYNADDMVFAPIFTGCVSASLYPFSIESKQGLYAEEIKCCRDSNGLGVRYNCCKLKSDGTGKISSFEMKLNMPGKFSVYNALAATVFSRLAGIPTASIYDALLKTRVGGRFETLELRSKPETTFIIDYAHNGASLHEVLRTLSDYPHDRIIVLFGSVGGRTYGRRAELGRVAAEMADFSILTADNPDYEAVQLITADIRKEFKNCGADDKCVEISDRSAAIRYAYEIARSGDIVLLAGKGHEKYQLIAGKRIPFSEREILLELDRIFGAVAPV